MNSFTSLRIQISRNAPYFPFTHLKKALSTIDYTKPQRVFRWHDAEVFLCKFSFLCYRGKLSPNDAAWEDHMGRKPKAAVSSNESLDPTPISEEKPGVSLVTPDQFAQQIEELRLSKTIKNDEGEEV